MREPEMAETSSELQSRRRMTGEQRKRSIVNTTVDLVARYGVRGTTTARIAAAEGISERALYKQFASRREILVAALECVVDRAYRFLDNGQETNAIAYLRTAAQTHWPLEPDFTFPLYEFFASSPQEDLREQVRTINTRGIDLVSQIIEDGKRQGVIRADVDPLLAAWQFWAVCWAQDVAYMLGLDDFGASGLSSRMIQSYLDGIAASGSDCECSAHAPAKEE